MKTLEREKREAKSETERERGGGREGLGGRERWMDRATGMGDRGTDSEMGSGERNLEAREPSSVRQGLRDTDKIRHRQTDRQTLRKCNTETLRASQREHPGLATCSSDSEKWGQRLD